MKFAVPTAALIILLGTTASSYARQEGRQEAGQGEHQQQGRPAQQQSRPAQQQQRPTQQQQRPAQQQQRPQPQQRQARPEARQQAPRAIPAQQHAEQARFRQPQGGPANRGQQSRPMDGRRNGHEHGRISNDHYAARFGREHSFHVHRGDYDHRRFRYGGYTFGFVEPWPIGWGYSDDVYVEYDDGGYYMYNRFHPGMRISIDML